MAKPFTETVRVIACANDDFAVRVAKTLDEACSLVEAGFEYVTDMEDGKILRKGK